MKMAGIKKVCAIVGAFDCQAQAGDTDLSGARLRSFVEEYLENPPVNDGLAHKVNNAGRLYSSVISEMVCLFEILGTLSIGYDIWESRVHQDKYFIDHYPQSEFIPSNIHQVLC